jgi:hypothetical protein
LVILLPDLLFTTSHFLFGTKQKTKERAKNKRLSKKIKTEQKTKDRANNKRLSKKLQTKQKTKD